MSILSGVESRFVKPSQSMLARASRPTCLQAWWAFLILTSLVDVPLLSRGSLAASESNAKRSEFRSMTVCVGAYTALRVARGPGRECLNANKNLD